MKLNEEDKSVSIITISYNAANTIASTIQSVLNQNYKNYEYIVIDGASNDGTYDIVCKYDEAFQSKGVSYFHISEPDGGIYDAMNKAIDFCHNEWIIYMNANDKFYNGEVLRDVFQRHYENDICCIYGSTWNVKNDRGYYKKAYPIRTITYRAPFVHQASFTRKEVLMQYKFNTCYSIAAERDLFIRMYTENKKFLMIDIVVAVYDLNGISQRLIEQGKKEWYDAWENAGMLKRNRIMRWWRMQFIPRLKQSDFFWNLYLKIQSEAGKHNKYG